ncbi:MAG TPA: GNAT family N-acetyltransferase [Streptosporangiaceae bacterium]|nr:GNAT family N-acetyltransferase [Streptosporangiaceae bacterium]
MTLLEERPTAADGQGTAPWVRIRPYESADGELIEAMSARLSTHSLYQRFFTGTPRLPRMYLAALAKTDHHDREALLAVGGEAVCGEALGGSVIGIAEYARDPAAPMRADLAVLVADDWHRRGIGRRLVTALAALAGSRGISDFRADTLTTNRPALAAIATLWPAVRADRDGATARFTLPVRDLGGYRTR